jgi:hypothetical protein
VFFSYIFVQVSEGVPALLLFVGYEKNFDSIETWAVLQSLQRCQVDCRWKRYIEVLKCLYENTTMSGRLKDQNSRPITLQWEVRQGDVISSKLFTAGLEDFLKTGLEKARDQNERRVGTSLSSSQV